MANFDFDQAEGLRRMLAGPRPRIVTFFSAASAVEKNALLVNLGASLANTVSDVLLLDAKPACNGIATRLRGGRGMSMLEAVACEGRLDRALQESEQGFRVATMGCPDKHGDVYGAPFAEAFKQMIRAMDVVMVDVEVDEKSAVPMETLASGEIVVQVAAKADSIKEGYRIIKQLNADLGRRSFGILVTGASEKEAHKVFANMAQAASRYLAVPLTSMGYVPADEHLARAARLGRTVVDAFPMANASVAIRSLAGRFAASGTGVGA